MPARVVSILCAWGAVGGAARADELNVRLHSVAHGLPQEQVNAMAQTPDGFLWLGTDAGLVRFDGVSFVPIEAPGERLLGAKAVLSLLVDRQGALWVGLLGGTGLVRMTNSGFESFHERLMDTARLGGVWNSIISMHQDRRGDL